MALEVTKRRKKLSFSFDDDNSREGKTRKGTGLKEKRELTSRACDGVTGFNGAFF